MNRLNVFKGENAILDFLNPDKNPHIPLVELPKKLNPFHKKKVRIFAKLMNLLPLLNVKSLAAYNMLTEAKKEGKLKGVHTIIENSSGNTVFSLAVIARFLGIKNTHAFVSHEVLRDKLDMLRLFGVKPIINEEEICPDPADKESGIYKAKRQGTKKSWFNAGQYDNDNNPKAHENWTGPQIWEQTEGKISVLCSGLGTTGTMVGTMRFLKKKNPSIKSLGIIRSPNNPVPGVRTRGLLKMIAFDWKKIVDHVQEVSTKQSYKKSLELIRLGLSVGPSSGFALAGLLNFLSKQKKLDKFRNKDGEVVCVFICADTYLPYIEEYFKYLDDSCFPKIENEELLLDKTGTGQDKIILKDFEIEPKLAFKEIYSHTAKEVKKRLGSNEPIKLKRNALVLDLRREYKFDSYHLPGSKRTEYRDIVLKKDFGKYVGKKVFVICPVGVKSVTAASVLSSKGIEAYSIKGGLMKWSELNLPRWKPNVCKKCSD